MAENVQVDNPAERAFWRWVEEYVSQPHPEIGRDGSVCPFVPRLVEEGNLFVEIDDTLDGSDDAAMEARMRRAVDDYLAMPDAYWKSLVIVFPNVADADVDVVDRVQASLKHDCVPKGLMVGQFHPVSTEPAARNPEFPANRSPLAAIALRHMSHHDIVFLDRSEEMFREFDARFGEQYRSGAEADAFLVDRYAAAAARFGANGA